MDSILKDYLLNIETVSPQEFKNMSVIGLKTFQQNDLEFLSLEDALKEDLITITVVDKSGTVPDLKAINRSDIPVLLLDGEELVGAKQNRVLNTSILLKENSEFVIPVSCTEEGRWSYKSAEFADSKHLASSRVRRAKSASVNFSLKNSREYRSDQSEVWEEIRQTHNRSGENSSTGALRDAYTSQEKNLAEYIEAFPLQEDQNGIIVLINGQVMGMEILYNHTTYSNYHEKLVKSYALDALLQENQSNNSVPVKEFIKTTTLSEQASYPSIGYGEDYRFENDYSVGSSLVWDGNIIHTAFFKKPEIDEECPVKLTNASARARYRVN